MSISTRPVTPSLDLTSRSHGICPCPTQNYMRPATCSNMPHVSPLPLKVVSLSIDSEAAIGAISRPGYSYQAPLCDFRNATSTLLSSPGGHPVTQASLAAGLQTPLQLKCSPHPSVAPSLPSYIPPRIPPWGRRHSSPIPHFTPIVCSPRSGVAFTQCPLQTVHFAPFPPGPPSVSWCPTPVLCSFALYLRCNS